jgi:uncharacterized Zn-binding protein involved in type VI secretion
MPGISRNGTDSAGGALISSQSTVKANGANVIVNGNSVASHAPCPDPASHCAATMSAGSNNVFIGGIAVVNAGDSASCGHSASGSNDVFVGD